MMNEREFLKEKKTVDTINARRIFNILWKLKYWLLLSVIIFLTGAYFYIRYTTPLYQKNISVVLNNQQNQYSDNYQLISNTFGGQSNNIIDNQIFLLRSTRLMNEVVKRGNLNIRYFSIGRFIEVEQYTNSPLVFSFIPEEGYKNAYLNMMVSLGPDAKVHIETLSINGIVTEPEIRNANIGEPINTSVGSFVFTAREGIDPNKLSGQLRITHSGEEHTAKVIAGRLMINPASKQTNVLTISLVDMHPKRSEDVLNILMEEYNILSKYYDSQNILSTISFLDERIAGLEEELREVEGSFSSYRSANELLDINSQSQIVMNNDKGYRERLNDVSLQISLLDIIKESIKDENAHELIPANIGVTDGALNASIDHYNQLVIERNIMLAGSSDNNPKVQNANTLLNSLKANIAQSIRNLESAYRITEQSVSRQLGSTQRELAAMPAKQLALTRMARLQQVKEPLYILLQQKREEALLTLSSLSDHAYVIDNAFGSDMPISPRKKEIYILAFLIALALPIGFVCLVNIFRSRILFEKDIIDRCDIPVLGIVPKAEPNKKSPMKALSVSEAGRDPLTESFRMLRSKFQYLNVNKTKPGAFILQVTSSGPKEGKSFISINMSLSLAYLGKKVLLIGADLRKPSVGKYLKLERNLPGLSDFLSGNIEYIHQIVVKDKGTANLDIIPAGPIPFNPSELLSSPLLEDTLDFLRSEYDYIIIDSAPFLVVSDSFMISKSVDSILYVVRSGFTKLAILDTLQNMYREGNFRSIMIILNSVDFRKNTLYGGSKTGAGYGYGYSYGYGYGHGAGYGYVSDNKEKKKNQKQ